MSRKLATIRRIDEIRPIEGTYLCLCLAKFPGSKSS